MSVDSYEWFAPSSVPRGYLLQAALRGAKAEIARRERREAVLSRSLSGDHAWRILLHVFVFSGPDLTVASLAQEFGMNKPEAIRWLLALQSEQLLVVGASDRVFLTAKCQGSLVDHFVEPFSLRRARRAWRVMAPSVSGLLKEGSTLLLSVTFLAGATGGPLLAAIVSR